MMPDQAPDWLEEWNRELGPRLLETTHLSIWEVVRRSAARFPDRPAIVEDGTVLTYHELSDAVLRCAVRLCDLGVEKGTRVAYLFGLSREWAVVHYALFRLGAVVVPINHMYESAEMRSVLQRSQAEVLITVDQVAGADQAGKFDAIFNGGADLPALHTVVQLHTEGYRVFPDAAAESVFGTPDGPMLSPLGPANGDDPATIYFTSGSTAAPKPALSAHRAYVGTATALSAALRPHRARPLAGLHPQRSMWGAGCGRWSCPTPPARPAISCRSTRLGLCTPWSTTASP